MAYKVIILYQLYMPSYFLGTFTEYPYFIMDEASCMDYTFIFMRNRIFSLIYYNSISLPDSFQLSNPLSRL